MTLNSVLIEIIACACLHVKTFGLKSDLNFFGKAISMVDSRSVVTVMFVDWSFGRSFRSVFKN